MVVEIYIWIQFSDMVVQIWIWVWSYDVVVEIYFWVWFADLELGFSLGHISHGIWMMKFWIALSAAYRLCEMYFEPNEEHLNIWSYNRNNQNHGVMLVINNCSLLLREIALILCKSQWISGMFNNCTRDNNTFITEASDAYITNYIERHCYPWRKYVDE